MNPGPIGSEFIALPIELPEMGYNNKEDTSTMQSSK